MTTPKKASAFDSSASLRLRGGGCNSSKGQVAPYTGIVPVEAVEEAAEGAAAVTEEVAAEEEAEAAVVTEEAEEVAQVTIDLDRYTAPTSIWAALLTGHVRLVKLSWLIAHSKAKGILPRRQELCEEAFISVAELQSIYGDGNRDDVLPIIAISFCWLTPPHPDPRGEQLALVAGELEREREKYKKLGFFEMGIFWDWVS